MKKMVLIPAFGVGFLLITGGLCRAGETLPPGLSKEIQALRNQMTEMKTIVQQQQYMLASQAKEIESLKMKIEPGEKPAYIAPAASALPSWSRGLTMGGDMRLRYEGISEASEATRDRNRMRLRLRYGFEKKLDEEFTVGFRLTTGATNDPTGSNATETGNFAFKDILIDRLYAKYQPQWILENVAHLKAFEIGGGKVANPYAETSAFMQWDQDVSPEGLYEKMETTFFGDRFRPFAILGQFPLDEGTTATDAELYAYQGGWRVELSSDPAHRPLTWTSAVAYYDFSDVAADSNFFADSTSLARGNTTLGGTRLAAGDFDILSVYQDLRFKVGSLPLKFYGEYDQNLDNHAPDPDGRDGSYQYGVVLGSAKARGDWELNYYYAYIEPDALYAALSESDFGDGHTNQMGHSLIASYMLTDFLKLRFRSTFTNDVIGTDDETRRFQADLEWKF